MGHQTRIPKPKSPYKPMQARRVGHNSLLKPSNRVLLSPSSRPPPPPHRPFLSAGTQEPFFVTPPRVSRCSRKMFCVDGTDVYGKVTSPVVPPPPSPPPSPEPSHGRLSLSEQRRKSNRNYRSLKHERKVKIQNPPLLQQVDQNVQQGDQNVQQGDQNVMQGDQNVMQGDQNVQQGDQNVQQGDQNVQQGDQNVQQGDQNVQQGDENLQEGDQIAPEEDPIVFEHAYNAYLFDGMLPQGNEASDVPKEDA